MIKKFIFEGIWEETVMVYFKILSWQ